MSKHFARRAAAGFIAVVMTFLLASAQASAADQKTSGNEPAPAAQTSRIVQAPAKGCSRPAGPTSSTSNAKAPGCQNRVYLDDFQVVHKAVSKPINTKMIWLGAKTKRPN